MMPKILIQTTLTLFFFLTLGRAWATGFTVTPMKFAPALQKPDPSITLMNQDIRQVIRQKWCQIIQDGEHAEYCPNPYTGIEFSDEYRLLCGTQSTDVCREDLKMSEKECPPYVFRPGGC